MKLPSSVRNIYLCHYLWVSVILALVYQTNALYEDQVGKFDWKRQLIGEPTLVYYHHGADDLFIATKENVIASLSTDDGSVNWRHLLPKTCILDNIFAIAAPHISNDFILRVSCSNQSITLSFNPQNGLLVEDVRLEEILQEDQAESIPSNSGQDIDKVTQVSKNQINKAFKLSGEFILIVQRDLVVSLWRDDRHQWSRDESLASIEAVEFIHLPSKGNSPNSLQGDRFGLRKLILAVTRNGNIFALDTFSGDIVWKLHDDKLSDAITDTTQHLVILVTKESDNDADSRAAILHPHGYVIEINPIIGEIIRNTTIPHIKQISKTDMDLERRTRSLIILDVNDAVHIYPPESYKEVAESINKYFMVTKDSKSSPNQLNGYKFTSKSNQIKSGCTWKFLFNSNEKIFDVGIKQVDELVHSPARVLGDRGVLYKYVNPNLIAVITQGESQVAGQKEPYVNVYLIDGISGFLVHSIHHAKARATAQVVHSENWLVYAFYNLKSRRTEISSLEMFEGAQNHNSSFFSSFMRSSSMKPKLIEHKNFIFPSGINNMVATVTLRAMTNRHIIIAMPSGHLLELPRLFLDPRRPINMLMEHREEGLIPYAPELPILSESVINYNQTLLGVKNIVTSPAFLESTCLVFEYGLDLFFTQTTPSKTFDILKDDFDHVLIAAVLIFLIVASYVSKLLAQRKALHAAWK